MRAIFRRLAAIESVCPPPPPEPPRIGGMTLYEIVDRLFENEWADLLTAILAVASGDAEKEDQAVILAILSVAQERQLAGQIVVRERRDGHSYWGEILSRRRSGLSDWQFASKFDELLVQVGTER